MREILFKAKSKETGKWVEGYYCMEHNNACFEGERKENHYIRFQRNIDWGITQQLLEEIDVDTLCEYTGLTDKNGKKIFENDLVKVKSYHYYQNKEYLIGKIVFKDGMFQINCEDGVNASIFTFQVWSKGIELIGNKFDKVVKNANITN